MQKSHQNHTVAVIPVIGASLRAAEVHPGIP